MKSRHLLLPLLLLLSALALAACGGGGDDNSGDEKEIEAAIIRSATTADPTNCTEVETQAFVEQSSDMTGALAVKDCETEAKDPTNNAKTVKVTKIEIDGDEATAEAAVIGGGFDGQTIAIDLVEEDGAWKLDQLAGFTELDTASAGGGLGRKTGRNRRSAAGSDRLHRRGRRIGVQGRSRRTGAERLLAAAGRTGGRLRIAAVRREGPAEPLAMLGG